MKSLVYEKALEFKRRYPSTVAWRIKAHAKVVEKHLNPGEVIKYDYVGQKNYFWNDIINKNLIVKTNKRLILFSKRLLFRYNGKQNV